MIVAQVIINFFIGYSAPRDRLDEYSCAPDRQHYRTHVLVVVNVTHCEWQVLENAHESQVLDPITTAVATSGTTRVERDP